MVKVFIKFIIKKKYKVSFLGIFLYKGSLA